MSLARLRLFQIVSPALPVGGFSYAEGLEVLVQGGRMCEAPAVGRWLEAELTRGLLPVEAAALRPLMELLAGWRECPGGAIEPPPSELIDLDGWLLAQREAPEMRAQQRQMGQSLLQLLADLGWPLPGSGPEGPPCTLSWPAAWAWAGVCLAIEPLDLVEAYLYGWCANQLSAAVRLVPLGPMEAQRLQLALGPTIARRARELVASDPHELDSGGIGAGMAQLGHAELYSRLFRS